MICGLVALLCSKAIAQFRAGIQVIWTDETGAVVLDAKVSLTNDEARVTQTT
jgi:hypothetical protein